SFLFNELAVFLHDEKSRLGGVREEAEYIRAKLELMRAFLSVSDAKEMSDRRLQVWIEQVRDVAYDAEDILDEFILRLANNHRDGFFGSLDRITWCVKKIKARHQIASKIHRIRQRIDNIFEDYGRFDLGSSSTVVNKKGLDRRGDELLIEEAELVDIEDSKFKQEVPKKVEIMDSHGMKEHIRNFLQHSRYVLVLDDVWSLEAWDDIEIAWPDNSRGSRVLLTTRDLKIASTCCLNSSGKTYTMNALSPKESWTLFCKKVFQGNDCPQPLYPLSKCFLEKCEGLPLAIVAMGGFLATKDRRIEEWDLAWRSLGDELESNVQFGFMTRIFLLSYFDLPSHLKVCLLYLGVFPEDYEIEKMRLIRLWIAEGFVEV
ncbi:hypothetical protein RJ640_027050, partial [Escallonia rubra]